MLNPTSLNSIYTNADWIESIKLIDPTDGSAIVIEEDDEITIDLRRRGCDRYELRLTQDDDAVTFPASDIVQWHFTKDQLSRFCAGTYELLVSITRDGVTDLVLKANLPILWGVRP